MGNDGPECFTDIRTAKCACQALLLGSVKAFFPQYAPKTATPRSYLEQNAFLQNSFLHEEMIFGIFVRFLQLYTSFKGG